MLPAASSALFAQPPSALAIPTMGMLPQVFQAQQAQEALKDRSAEMVQQHLSNMSQEMAKKVDSMRLEMQSSLQTSQEEFQECTPD